jgi:hypothetical protein
LSVSDAYDCFQTFGIDPGKTFRNCAPYLRRGVVLHYVRISPISASFICSPWLSRKRQVQPQSRVYNLYRSAVLCLFIYLLYPKYIIKKPRINHRHVAVVHRHSVRHFYWQLIYLIGVTQFIEFQVGTGQSPVPARSAQLGKFYMFYKRRPRHWTWHGFLFFSLPKEGSVLFFGIIRVQFDTEVACGFTFAGCTPPCHANASNWDARAPPASATPSSFE